ncbi:MAG: hypothetical protein WBV67_04365, partial [Candidatus Cybelea sp.]|jgi:hypothetical protein
VRQDVVFGCIRLRSDANCSIDLPSNINLALLGQWEIAAYPRYFALAQVYPEAPKRLVETALVEVELAGAIAVAGKQLGKRTENVLAKAVPVNAITENHVSYLAFAADQQNGHNAGRREFVTGLDRAADKVNEGLGHDKVGRLLVANGETVNEI